MSGILMMSVGNSYGSLPVNTVAPVVSGTATFGQTLTTTNGTWTAAPAITGYTYQWQRNTSNIGGATSSTYVLQSADIGNTVRCVVTATNAVGSTSANSNSTATVQDAYWAAVLPLGAAASGALYGNASRIYIGNNTGRGFLSVAADTGLSPTRASTTGYITPAVWSDTPGRVYYVNQSNGDFILSGSDQTSTFEPTFQKINSAGAAQFTRRITGDQQFVKALEVDSSGFIWTLHARSNQNQYILRTDSSGTAVSYYRVFYSNTDYNFRALTPLITDASNNILFGFVKNFNGSTLPRDSRLVKYDSTMTTRQFEKNYFPPSYNASQGQFLIYNMVSSGSDYYGTAYGLPNSDAANITTVIFKLNSSGDVLWSKALAAPSLGVANPPYVDPFGKVWVCSNVLTTQPMQFQITRFSSSGNVELQRRIIVTSGISQAGYSYGACFVQGSVLYVTGFAAFGSGNAVLLKVPYNGSKTGTYGGITWSTATTSVSNLPLTVTSSTQITLSNQGSPTFNTTNPAPSVSSPAMVSLTPIP